MTVTAMDTYQQSAALAIRPGQEMWNDKQRAALAVLGIRDASNADLAVFMHVSQRTGLDPFSKQIYMIKRRVKEDGQWIDKWTIQTGIDGFRVIRDRVAERQGVTVEYEDTIWYDHDGGEHKVWLRDDAPAGCVVTVVKDGRRYPGALRFSSYAARQRDTGELTGQWKTMPDHMIEKCCEAFALRRAFPHDLGGIGLEDETPQQEPGAPAVIRQRGRVTVAEVIETGPAAPAANGNGHTAASDAEPSAEADSDEPGRNPGSVPTALLGTINTLFGSQFGFKRSESGYTIKVCEEVIGRELDGPHDGRALANLSEAEAIKLLDTLEGIESRAALDELVGRKPEGSGPS
jgi:phage recombination protein Bet